MAPEVVKGHSPLMAVQIELDDAASCLERRVREKPIQPHTILELWRQIKGAIMPQDIASAEEPCRLCCGMRENKKASR